MHPSKKPGNETTGFTNTIWSNAAFFYTSLNQELSAEKTSVLSRKIGDLDSHSPSPLFPFPHESLHHITHSQKGNCYVFPTLPTMQKFHLCSNRSLLAVHRLRHCHHFPSIISLKNFSQKIIQEKAFFFAVISKGVGNIGERRSSPEIPWNRAVE